MGLWPRRATACDANLPGCRAGALYRALDEPPKKKSSQAFRILQDGVQRRQRALFQSGRRGVDLRNHKILGLPESSK